MATKVCSKCIENKEINKFGVDKRAVDGKQSCCKNCYRLANNTKYAENKEFYKEYSKNKYKKDPIKYRSRQLKAKYGIDLEKKLQMIAFQNNQCSICKVLFDSAIAFKVPCVDHDHKTGKVRDILCSRCNSTLGYIEENTEIALSMASYIENHRGSI